MLGIVFTNVDGRATRLKAELDAVVNEAMPGRRFSTVISQAVIIPMLSGKGKTLFQMPKYDRICVARQYKQLAAEVEHRVLNRDAYLAGELEELPRLAVAPVVVADELDVALAMA